MSANEYQSIDNIPELNHLQNNHLSLPYWGNYNLCSIIVEFLLILGTVVAPIILFTQCKNYNSDWDSGKKFGCGACIIYACLSWIYVYMILVVAIFYGIKKLCKSSRKCC